MKINFFIYLSVVLIVSMPTFAQNRDRNNGRGSGRDSLNREDFMANRNTYLTKEMGLTAAEAAVFFPIENELFIKKIVIRRDCGRLERELRTKSVKTDDDFKKLLKCREEEKDNRDKLDKEYLQKFKKVLSAEKILKYQNADHTFGNEFFRDRR